ncbi:hypothetical protein MKK75_17740 [Methylobacterium sp. J-030]|uniref:hypothetical protein n=1 Tax=Methylobacterium sp. J-030 TaxID=2836627 RepID=UPI001FBB19AF|nr:hypothetical protein [Methylobacterium sp. J-030]MCJ2070612.1 hypothetical protein [Methylobacterium sp. J-030]
MRNGPQAAAVDRALGLESILPWSARAAAIGHGRAVPVSAERGPIESRTAAGGLPGLVVDAPVAGTPDDVARVPVPVSV